MTIEWAEKGEPCPQCGLPAFVVFSFYGENRRLRPTKDLADLTDEIRERCDEMDAACIEGNRLDPRLAMVRLLTSVFDMTESLRGLQKIIDSSDGNYEVGEVAYDALVSSNSRRFVDDLGDEP